MEAATSKRKGGKVKEENEEAFHFIAYVPVDGVVWELDGMRRQPVRLGIFLWKSSGLIVGEFPDDEWLDVATPRIQERIERYSAEEIRFNLLAVAQRPLPLLQSQLNGLNILSTTLQSHLNTFIPDWKLHIDSIPATTESSISSSLLSQAIEQTNPQEFLSLKKATDREIALLKMRIIDEEQKISEYMVRYSQEKALM